MADAATFLDATARATRTTENTTADWDTGMNWANCNPGIGISGSNPGLVENPGKWTLLDQNGAARDPQLGQSIGGVGLNGGTTNAASDPFLLTSTPGTGDGAATASAAADLLVLANGWTPQP